MERYGMNNGFQTRRMRRLIMCAVIVMLAMHLVSIDHIGYAQETDWPLPGIAPDVMVGAEYALETFDHIYTPMHQGMVYGGIRSSYGAYLLKVARGRRFSQNGFQGEIEAYPPLGERMYGYASYAYGETPVYPRHRIGVEVFRGMGGGFEASLGGRFFSFLTDQSVLLGTGSLSYYTGKFIFTAKPFVSLNTSKTAVAGVFSTRYYLSENEEFLTGRVTGGFTTDERWIQTSQGIPGQQTALVQSQSLGFAIQKIVARKVMFLGRLDLTRQEVVFRPDTYVLDIAVGCGFRLLL